MNTIGAFEYNIEPKMRFGLLTFTGSIFLGGNLRAVTEAWSAEGCLNQVFSTVRRLNK